VNDFILYNILLPAEKNNIVYPTAEYTASPVV